MLGCIIGWWLIATVAVGGDRNIGGGRVLCSLHTHARTPGVHHDGGEETE